ncbi:hypothetical protein ACKWTF_010163 [Chironomus riparius]
MYTESNDSTAELYNQTLRGSEVSVYNIEEDLETEKNMSVWDSYKTVILICIVICGAVSVIAAALLIFWPKPSFDLKSHINYPKFSRNGCTLNQAINFQDDSSLFEFPWLVRILRKNGNEDKHSCVAFVIADDLLLTASHCLDEDEDLKISEIVLSSTFGDNFNKIIPRKYLQLIQHRDYIENNDERADIGLIKLSQPLTFTSSFYPACLPFDNLESPNSLSLIHWSSHDISTNDIKNTKTASINSRQCQDKYDKAIPKKDIQFYKDENRAIFCVDYNAAKTLSGDSGSPAILFDNIGAKVYGILLSGGDQTSQLPDLYITIRTHLSWILDNA